MHGAMPGKHHLTTYQAAELIDLLRASARANGVSLSAEVRGRLLASYKHEAEQQRAAVDASTQVLSFPDGRTAVVTLTCQSLPMDTVTPAGDVLADGGQQLAFSTNTKPPYKDQTG